MRYGVDFRNTLSAEQLERFAGKDLWVYGRVTDGNWAHDYYINIIYVHAGGSEEEATIACYLAEAFYIDLCFDGIALSEEEINYILRPLKHDPGTRYDIWLADIDIPANVDVLTTDEILEVLES